MTKIQIDIPEHINKKVLHYKIDKGSKTKAEAISEILTAYFTQNPDIFEVEEKEVNINETN